MYRFLVLLCTLGAVCCQADPECLCVEELEAVRGFRNPLVITHAGDGSDRLFVGEWIMLTEGNSLLIKA